MLFKVTDEHGQTKGHDGTVYQWGPFIWNEAASSKARGEWVEEGIFVYDAELIAAFFAPLIFVKPKLWSARGEVISSDKHFGVLCRGLTTLSELPLPVITPIQRTHFAILSALSVYESGRFIAWADAWLKGTDRSAEAARVTAEMELTDAPEDLLRKGRWRMPWLNAALSACAAAQALHDVSAHVGDELSERRSQLTGTKQAHTERVVTTSWHAALHAKACKTLDFADLIKRSTQLA